MRLESKIGTIHSPDKDIYNYLTNFENFKNLIPQDKINDWQSDENSCSFNIDPVGKTGVKIIEKEPHKLVKLTGIDESPYNFTFWLQLKQTEEKITKVKLTMDVELNAMLQMMAKKPLQEFLNKLIDQLEKYNFPEST